MSAVFAAADAARSSHSDPSQTIYIVLAVLLVIAVLVMLRMSGLLRALRRQRNDSAPADDLLGDNSRFLRRDNLVASFRIDLTADTVSGGCKPVFGFPSNRYDGPLDELVDRMRRLVHPSMQDDFFNQFRRQNLLFLYDSGTYSVREPYLFLLEGKGYAWLRIYAELNRDPNTGHIMALGYGLDINRLKRLEEICETLITTEYTRMGLLDARSGWYLPFRTGHELSGTVDEDAGFLSYEGDMLHDLEGLMYPAEYKDLRPSLSLDRIVAALEHQPFYDLTFRTAPTAERPIRHLKLRYRYLNDLRESIVFTSVDISALVATTIDPLTALYNSHGFVQRVDGWLRDNPGRPYRLIFFDFDDFRYINATFGHQSSMDLLHDNGLYLHEHDGPSSFSGHLNSGQFVRFCAVDDGLTPEESYALFLKHYHRYKLDYPIHIHMGVYDLCEPDCDAYTMIYKALLAQQTILGDQTRRIAYYTADMGERSQRQHTLLSDVRTALEEDQFQVWFQPQFNYTSGVLIGAEALVRWHPSAGAQQPDLPAGPHRVGKGLPLGQALERYGPSLPRVRQHLPQRAAISRPVRRPHQPDLPLSAFPLPASFGDHGEHLRGKHRAHVPSDRPPASGRLHRGAGRLRRRPFLPEHSEGHPRGRAEAGHEVPLRLQGRRRPHPHHPLLRDLDGPQPEHRGHRRGRGDGAAGPGPAPPGLPPDAGLLVRPPHDAGGAGAPPSLRRIQAL